MSRVVSGGSNIQVSKKAKSDQNRDLFKAGQFFKICLKIIPLQTVPECKSWSWASPQHSTPLACSLHYGEHRCDLLVISPFLDALAYLASLATPIPSLAWGGSIFCRVLKSSRMIWSFKFLAFRDYFLPPKFAIWLERFADCLKGFRMV